jgi:hypothetical protein
VDRDQLKPWFSFLKLFLTALHKLPSPNKTVWHGVKNADLSEQWGNRRVMRCSRQNKTNGQIIISNIDCSCLAIDRHENLYVSDCGNHRTQKFEIDSNFLFIYIKSRINNSSYIERQKAHKEQRSYRSKSY